MSESAVRMDQLFTSAVRRNSSEPAGRKPQEAQKDSAVAVIGMACCTADASRLEDFWDNLVQGRDSIIELPASRKKKLLPLAHEGVFNTEIFKAGTDGSPGTLPHLGKKGYLDGIDLFDPDFFHMTAKEARLMDPMQRRWLQTAYHALEDAGYGGNALAGTDTGVFVGSSKDMSLEYIRYVEYFEPISVSQCALGNLTSAMPGRLCHFMDFHGPSIHIDTACSSSLVAVHLACMSILNGECAQAVAGGVRLRVIPFTHKHPIGIESPSDTSRPFDINADGTAEGEGVGAVILKPLSRALSDGDYIYAVIKGSALTQDGRGAGLGVPNGEAQKRAILKAWENAGIDPGTISYFEAHGTATKVGDPIEIEAITSAFNLFTPRRQFCAVGAVKSNIGHLYEASGIFGLIKTIKSLEQRLIPPTLHFNVPNRNIAFEDSPFYVPIVTESWPQGSTPRRSCISSFGISGTNCHMVLEESPQRTESIAPITETEFLFTLSAKTAESLRRLMRSYLELPDDYGRIGDICYTANKGRGHYHYRVAFCVRSLRDLKNRLSSFLACTETSEAVVEPDPGKKKSLQQQVDELLGRLKDQTNHAGILSALAELYQQGADISWKKYYRRSAYRSLPLPAYPYHERPYWVELPFCVDLREHAFFTLRWNSEPLPAFLPSAFRKEQWLVLYSPSAQADRVIAGLESVGHSLVKGELADTYSSVSPEHFLFSADKADLDRFISICPLTPTMKILNLLPLALESESMLYLFLDLAKTLVRHFPGRPFEIVNIATAVYPLEQQPIKPENRMLFTFSRSLSLEIPDLQTRSIDAAPETLEELSAVLTDQFSKDYYLALRKDRVYKPVFDLEDYEAWEDDEIALTGDGCYVITGGMGGIGLEIARYLGRTAAINIVLVGRTRPKPGSDFEAIIRDIEAAGSSVLIESADVTDRGALKSLLGRLRTRFKKISGIIHGAGIIDDGPMFSRDEDSLRNVMAPKVAGTVNLHELTEDDPPDIMILFSSLSAVFNNIYQAGYASANAFMDAFAQWRNDQGLKTIAINWPSWQETGMAYRAGLNRDNIFKALKTSSGLQLFELILRKSPCNCMPGIINTAMDLELLLPNYGYAFSERMKYQWELEKNVKSSRKARNTGRKVAMAGRADNHYSPIEIKLCELIGDIFGMDCVDITAGFFDLGGDSITALSLYYQLPDIFGMKSNVSVEDFIKAASLEQIAVLIGEKL